MYRAPGRPPVTQEQWETVVSVPGEEPASLSAECRIPWALNFLGYIIHLELVFQLDPRNGCAGVVILNTDSWATCTPSVQSNPERYQELGTHKSCFDSGSKIMTSERKCFRLQTLCKSLGRASVSEMLLIDFFCY